MQEIIEVSTDRYHLYSDSNIQKQYYFAHHAKYIEQQIHSA